MKNTMIVLLALLLPACVCAQQDVQTPKHILKTLDKQIQQQMTIALQRAATEELLAFLKTPQAKKTQILRKHVRRLVQEGANVNGQDKDGNRVFTLALRTGDADTVAGLLLELKGEFPALHEKVSYERYEFEVLEMDNRRILKVKFTVNPLTAEAEGNA